MSHRLSKEKEGGYECLVGVDVLTVTKPEKRQCGPLRQDLLVILQKPVVSSFFPSLPLPSDNQKTHASRLAGRREEMAASDDLREGWKHGEVWVNGRPESPPVRPNQDQ